MTRYRVRLLLDVTLDAREAAHAEDVVRDTVLESVEDHPRFKGHKVRWCHAIKEEDE